MSNLTEVIVVHEGDSKPSQPSKKREPNSEILANFSRVTPSQLSYIAFPTEGRFKPVRAIAPTKTNKTGKNAGTLSNADVIVGGGGILILQDRQLGEEVELIEWHDEDHDVPMDVNLPAPVAQAPAPVVDDGPEAEPPESFEVRFFYVLVATSSHCFLSIHLTMIPDHLTVFKGSKSHDIPCI